MDEESIDKVAVAGDDAPVPGCRFGIEGADAARCARFTERFYSSPDVRHCVECILDSILAELRAIKKD